MDGISPSLRPQPRLVADVGLIPEGGPWKRLFLIGMTIAVAASAPFVEAQRILEKAAPQLSGFFAVREFSLVDDGIGNIGKFDCVVSTAAQPSDYDGNMLADLRWRGAPRRNDARSEPDQPRRGVLSELR